MIARIGINMNKSVSFPISEVYDDNNKSINNKNYNNDNINYSINNVNNTDVINANTNLNNNLRKTLISKLVNSKHLLKNPEFPLHGQF